MKRFPLTWEGILAHTDEKVFARGEEYYENGLVLSVVQRGDTVYGEVEGSEEEAYSVVVTFLGEGEIEADCDCPYDWGGWCKHIVAVLLTCLRDARKVETKIALETLLEPLSREDLQRLVLRLARTRPGWMESVVEEIRELRST